MPSCEWQSVVRQSASETGDGKRRYRCIHCGFLTDPVQSPLYRDEYSHRECPAKHGGRIVVEMPGIFEQYTNFATSLAEHVALGSPASTRAEIIESFRICSPCENYNDLSGQCCECGCYVNLALHNENLNKLAWANEACPIGKWKSPLERRAEAADKAASP